MANTDTKVTFRIKGTNGAEITAGSLLTIQDQEAARKHDNLPHNSLVIANLNTTCTLYIFLDDFSNQDTPDYILFPSQQINVNLDDGVSFETVILKNTHASDSVSANEIKYNIMTIKEVA